MNGFPVNLKYEFVLNAKVLIGIEKEELKIKMNSQDIKKGMLKWGN